MSSTNLNTVPDVDIDQQGVFKYILMKIYERGTKENRSNKLIVRGYKDCPFHGDIFDKVYPSLQANNLDAECMGGGRINHDPQAKKILVYGYSQGYGKADHNLSVAILKKTFPDYDITWSDDGY